ncbi:MAG: 16S rRNA (cytosine(1402)-N(4))-methyltransferase RsmH [Chitinophagales bacterium]
MSSYHETVLLRESVEALAIQDNETYVDVTFGGGGHSSLILRNLKTGRLVAFDQDEDAKSNLLQDEKLIFVPHNFKYLKRFLKYHNQIPVSGVLADLGISSYQIDAGEKGFSTRFEGPMDMRMNQDADLTAEQILLTYSEVDLVRIFSEYGEVRNSKTLAKAIVGARQNGIGFSSTKSFVGFLKNYIMGKENRYLAQVFQALRIEVNDELGVLKSMLEQSLDVLKVGGRLAIITFHSLEDRLVKNFLKTGNFEGKMKQDDFGRALTPFKLVNKKPIEASEEELKVNPRSRSAKLRIAEKL